MTADQNLDSGLPIRMLHDRVLVRMEGSDGERRSTSGIVIPATATMGKRLAWATAVGVGPSVRSIVVGDRENWYIYRVTEQLIVKPSAVEVVAPVPGNARAKPKKAMLTLTTCHPKYDNYQRLIIHAEMVRSQPKADGTPAELGG